MWIRIVLRYLSCQIPNFGLILPALKASNEWGNNWRSEGGGLGVLSGFQASHNDRQLFSSPCRPAVFKCKQTITSWALLRLLSLLRKPWPPSEYRRSRSKSKEPWKMKSQYPLCTLHFIFPLPTVQREPGCINCVSQVEERYWLQTRSFCQTRWSRAT